MMEALNIPGSGASCKDTIFQMEPPPPKTWKQFEEAVKALHYRITWGRYSSGDTLRMFQDYQDDFWKDYPHLAELDLRYGIEIDKYLGKTADLHQSKRMIVDQAAEILAEARRRIARLPRLWPVLEALARRNEDRKYQYARVSVQLVPSGIRLSCYDYEISIDDELTITSASIETRGKMTRDELNQRILDLELTTSEYRRFLEPFRAAQSMDLQDKVKEGHNGDLSRDTAQED